MAQDGPTPVPERESAAKKLERDGAIVEPPPAANPPARPEGKSDSQMQVVLDELGALGGKPVESLKPEDARKQPTPADAVKKVMDTQDRRAPRKSTKSMTSTSNSATTRSRDASTNPKVMALTP